MTEPDEPEESGSDWLAAMVVAVAVVLLVTLVMFMALMLDPIPCPNR
jgi:succinate dehydrogenase hydrophobic anchor subunit